MKTEKTMEKRFEDFLKKERAFEAFNNNVFSQRAKTFREIEMSDPFDYVVCTFCWLSTKEGHAFWSNIDEKWKSQITKPRGLAFNRHGNKSIKFHMKKMAAILRINSRGRKRIKETAVFLLSAFWIAGIIFGATYFGEAGNTPAQSFFIGLLITSVPYVIFKAVKHIDDNFGLYE